MADFTHPTELMGLEDFCRAANALLGANEVEDFIRFVLNGISTAPPPEGPRQIVLDPLLNRLQPNDPHIIKMSRDFDSVLGFNRDIQVTGMPLVIYPIPKFEDSLSKNIHLTYRFRSDIVSPINLCGYNED